MNKKFIAGGCSFTFGNELSDDKVGKSPSNKSWSKLLCQETKYPGAVLDYVNVASPGAGNPGIARRVFEAVKMLENEDRNNIDTVVVMWSFLSRYDWAMPRHESLENTRWTSISPWDTDIEDDARHNQLAGSEIQIQDWTRRRELVIETGVKPFADTLYRYAANQYHEIYLSWKSILWLQNFLEKKNIKYMFTLADNSLFYDGLKPHKDQDKFMTALHSEIDFTKWHSFGARMMGFNQWAKLNEYEYATTHPLDKAHVDAVKLMIPTFKNCKLGGKNV